MSWMHRLLGKDGISQARVSADFFALATFLRPPTVSGSYRIAPTTGLIAVGVAALAPIFSARWTSSTHLCIPRYISVTGTITTAPTTAQRWGFDIVRARGFTVSDSAQTAVVLSGDNAKKKNSHDTSKFATGDMRVSGTGAITAGTRTIDSDPLASDTVWELVAAATVARSKVKVALDGTDAKDFPTVLAQNEGIIVRNKILTAATMVYEAVIEFAWDEVLIADF